MSTIKSVAYSFCDGFEQPYALDCVLITNGKLEIDVHGKYETREEFMAAIEGVIPMFKEPTQEEEGGDPTSTLPQGEDR
jgi:hypothetical protein